MGENEGNSLALNEDDQGFDLVGQVGISDIADQIAGNMPPVTDHSATTAADDHKTAAPAEGQPQYFDPRNPPDDFDAYTYNPKYHQEDPENPGHGILNTNGTFRKKGGRPRKTSKPESSGAAAPGQVFSEIKVDPADAAYHQEHQEAGAEQLPDPELAATADAATIMAGTACSNAVAMLLQTTMGQEWILQSHEKEAAEQCWIELMRSKGVTDIPPTVGLMMIYGTMLASRINQPQTKKKASGLFSWMKKSIRKWRFRRLFGNAPFDTGNDDERKEHSGQANDQAVSGHGDQKSGL